MERDRGGRGRATFLPHEQKCLCGPKKKTSEKSPPASLDFREQKISWLAFLAIAMILRLVQKRFLGPAKKRMGCCWFFKKRNWRSFFAIIIEDALPSTSHCTCRLNNVHTYQTTHLQSHCHMLLSSGTFYFHRPNVRRLV
jgi:hypothetical protein